MNVMNFLQASRRRSHGFRVLEALISCHSAETSRYTTLSCAALSASEDLLCRDQTRELKIKHSRVHNLVLDFHQEMEDCVESYSALTNSIMETTQHLVDVNDVIQDEFENILAFSKAQVEKEQQRRQIVIDMLNVLENDIFQRKDAEDDSDVDEYRLIVKTLNNAAIELEDHIKDLTSIHNSFANIMKGRTTEQDSSTVNLENGLFLDREYQEWMVDEFSRRFTQQYIDSDTLDPECLIVQNETITLPNELYEMILGYSETELIINNLIQDVLEQAEIDSSVFEVNRVYAELSRSGIIDRLYADAYAHHLEARLSDLLSELTRRLAIN